MTKYLGIDFGDVYIGLALASETVALPYKVVKYNKKFWEFLQKLVVDEAITDMVVGWPRSLTGAENARTEKTEEFIQKLENTLGITVHREDERMTTAAAKRRVTKGRDDAIAASEILQTFLDSHAESGHTI